MFAANCFQGKTALITGAADGIGHACALTFARLGAQVILVDLRLELAKQKALALPESDKPHLALYGDVTDETSVGDVFAQLASEQVLPDFLVNNAGIADMGKPTLQQHSEQFDRIVKVSVHGTYLMSKAFAHALFTAPPLATPAAIVNLASIAGLMGLPNRNAYSAAKAGVAAMTRSMASEWGRVGSRTPRAIRVNAVAPGYVETSMVEGLIAKGMFDVAGIKARTPMQRLAAPQEVANVIAFLCSDLASFITGVTLPIDGGWSAFGAVQSALDR